MANDKFQLTLPQIIRLNEAFRRNGWTAEDIYKLCTDDVLSQVLRSVRRRNNSTHLSSSHLPFSPKQSIHTAFSQERCRTLPSYTPNRWSRAMQAFKYFHTHKPGRKVKTVSDATGLTRRDLLGQPNLGRRTVALISEMLSLYGLQLKP